MGIAIYRRDADGYLQPVEYKSKAFVDTQKKLPAHDRECLALLYALKSFRHYLLHREFEVQTDNSALAPVFSSRDLSDLYARWYHKIAEFSGMRIVHRPGSNNTAPTACWLASMCTAVRKDGSKCRNSGAEVSMSLS
jgi:hypothetical protein